MNAAAAKAPSAVFTSEELTLLVDVAEVSPLFSWNSPELDEDGWDAVYRGLRARGVLVQGEADEDAFGVSIAVPLRPLLGVAFLAERATTVSIGTKRGVSTRTILRMDGVALEHEEVARGIHGFTPVAGSAVVEFVLAPLLVAAGIVDPGPAEPVQVPIDRYVDVLRQLGDGDLEGARTAWPEGAAYLEHLATEPDSVSINDLERMEDGDVRFQTLSFHIGAGRHWLVSMDETEVSVRPVGRASAEALVRELVA